ncbi:MAG: aldehyde dehydrogenase family protein [Saprospiraceae bacterium]|nr:aldehyde dehydrogenase family protein [Saprospiraceae bacterium]
MNKNLNDDPSTFSSEDLLDSQLIFNKASIAQKVVEGLSIKQRIDFLLRANDYIMNNQEALIDQICKETGKTRFDALSNEIFSIGDFVDYYRKATTNLLADRKVQTSIVMMGKKSKVFFSPLGVILAITPWNYPLYQMFMPAMTAFLAGNATIIKPSEHTPLKGVFEQLLEKCGFPEDAIQIVYGNGLTGSKLIACRPDKIHFTGSVNTGKKIMAQAAKQLIPVELELGGNDPAIVFDDINLSRTANGLVWGAFTNAGQSCTSIERAYIHENIYDSLLEELLRITNKLRFPSNAQDCNSNTEFDLGYITVSSQLNIINEHLEDALSKGAKIECGGKLIENSQYFEPTILSGVTHDMIIMQEESFGPFLPLMKFSNENQVINLANDSKYGLSASVWSKDLNRATRVARKLKTGNVSINNVMLTEGNHALPFGGINDSGFGRIKGSYGLESFCNVKSVIIDKQSKIIDPHWYPQTKTKYNTMTDLMQTFFMKTKKWIKFAIKGMKMDALGNKEKI